MTFYQQLLENNKAWVEEKLSQDADFFENLAKGQQPAVLWIGCSDSRVPAEKVTGVEPGEMFVHRNIANVVVHTDMNVLSVLDYAINVLKVKYIIVCGHYGCGGVQGALLDKPIGLIDNWLRHIKDVKKRHEAELAECKDDTERLNKLVELNVQAQVANIRNTSLWQDANANEEAPVIHGWVHNLKTGLIKELC
ncbi:carbonic anhydrase [Rapidithrix thailandica]|uniref:Carbonic anhydrase 2 n=1 Tax=Rapidithrix thailandica TaxID=413964 RepID=A0AAW9S620_9BACT